MTLRLTKERRDLLLEITRDQERALLGLPTESAPPIGGFAHVAGMKRLIRNAIIEEEA